jgi:hypothetical protein
MAILDKTRKILWGQSGNRCAICKCALVVDASDFDDESVVGDECHIVSAHAHGPRHNPDFPLGELDTVSNLILLCRVHHKMVDDQYETYSTEVLLQLKIGHESWVSRLLSEQERQQPIRIRRLSEQEPVNFLLRLTSGKDLMAIASGSYQASINHEEPGSEEEADLFASFLREFQDWLEMWNEIDSGEKVKASFALSEGIRELERSGFGLFGAREMCQIEGGVGTPHEWPVVHLKIGRLSVRN